jgi:hypothetical protein
MGTREIARKVPAIDAGVSGVVRSVRSAMGNGSEANAASVYCQNCGAGDRRTIPERPVVEDTRLFEETPGIRLCNECDRARRSETTSIVTCSAGSYPVDEAAVYADGGDRCRGCGISDYRLELGGQELALHPVVPLDGDGHAHDRNLVALCPYCHRRTHGKD